jgi:hypothetical protein
MRDSGVVYIAMGDKYVREARLSAQSLKKHNELPITLITDKNASGSEFDNIQQVDTANYSFGDIVENISDTPYERTLYLDTDTYICSNIQEIFSILTDFDIAICEDGTGWHMDEYDLSHPVKDVPEGFPWYNGGVIAFSDNAEINECFTLWQSEFLKDTKDGIIHNMPSLRHALYYSDVRIATLPHRYNCLFRDANHLLEQAKIFHGRIIEINGVGANKNYSIHEAKEALNSNSSSRVYIPLRGGRFEVIDSKPTHSYNMYPESPDNVKNILIKIIASIESQGVLSTMKSGFRYLSDR